MDARDLEKAFEKLLVRALREGLEHGGPECPGPDILAAFLDRSLSHAEAARWERHFARCARCQQTLAAVDAAAVLRPSEETQVAAAKAADLKVAAAAAAPPLAAKAAIPSLLRGPEEEARPRRHYWRWLAPAVGVAAVVVFWIAVRPTLRHSQAPIAEAPQEVVQNTQPPAPEAEAQPYQGTEKKTEPSPPAPAAERGAAKAGPEVAAAKPVAPAIQPPTVLDRAGRETKGLPPAGAPAAAPAAEPRDAASARKENAEQQLPTLQKQAQGPGTQTQRSETLGKLITETPKKTEAGKAGQKRAGGLAGAPPPAAATQSQTGGVAVGETAMKLRSKGTPPPAIVVSPNLSVWWRVGLAGSIERSGDAGRTWQAQTSNVKEDLLAGSAPSETICWVVGRAGTILRTTDGEQWENISSPAAVDWIAVRAQDDLRATVVSADQQRYATSDGGKTWRGPLGK